MRIAFDLDETLGVSITNGHEMIGFQKRKGCIELLESIKRDHELILWSVSHRRYVDKSLKTGLSSYFLETYSWDEKPCDWKDIRNINADFLIDDSEYYKMKAAECGIEDGYIIIPAYESYEDQKDPLLWIKMIREKIDDQ